MLPGPQGSPRTPPEVLGRRMMSPNKSSLGSGDGHRGSALGWITLLIAGQGAAVHLTSAGPSIGYQHLTMPWSWNDDASRTVAALILVTQALLVSAALWRHRQGLAAGVNRLGGIRIVGTVVLLMALTSAALSRDITVYIIEVATATMIQIMALLTAVLAAVAAPRRDLVTPAAVGQADDALRPRHRAPDVRAPGRLRAMGALRRDRVPDAGVAWCRL